MLTSLRWVRESPNHNTKELIAVVQYKTSGRDQPAVVLGFLCTNVGFLRELSTQRVRHVLRAPKKSSDWASKDFRIKVLATFLICDRMAAVMLLNGGRFRWLISKSNHRQTKPLFVNFTTPTCFEDIIFTHCKSIFNDELQKKTITVPEDDRAGTPIGFCVQLLLRT